MLCNQSKIRLPFLLLSLSPLVLPLMLLPPYAHECYAVGIFSPSIIWTQSDLICVPHAYTHTHTHIRIAHIFLCVPFVIAFKSKQTQQWPPFNEILCPHKNDRHHLLCYYTVHGGDCEQKSQERKKGWGAREEWGKNNGRDKLSRVRKHVQTGYRRMHKRADTHTYIVQFIHANNTPRANILASKSKIYVTTKCNFHWPYVISQIAVRYIKTQRQSYVHVMYPLAS